MDMSPNKPRPRNVTKNDLVSAFLVVIYGIAALIVKSFYSETLGYLLLAGMLIIPLMIILRLPKEQKVALDEKVKQQERTPLGRIFKVGEYIIYAAILSSIILWLFEKYVK